MRQGVLFPKRHKPATESWAAETREISTSRTPVWDCLQLMGKQCTTWWCRVKCDDYQK